MSGLAKRMFVRAISSSSEGPGSPQHSQRRRDGVRQFDAKRLFTRALSSSERQVTEKDARGAPKPFLSPRHLSLSPDTRTLRRRCKTEGGKDFCALTFAAAAGCRWIGFFDEQVKRYRTLPSRSEVHKMYDAARHFRAPVPFENDIDKDVDRTFPKLPLFASRGGVGQIQLKRLLRTFVLYYPKVGYTQGMNFVAATLLRHLPSEVDAYFVFISMMFLPKWNLQHMYCEGLPMLKAVVEHLDGLVCERLPGLHAHLCREGLYVQFFSQHWFMGIFTTSFGTGPESSRIITDLWDMFFRGGWPKLLDFCVHLLRHLDSHIIGRSFDDIAKVFACVKEGSSWGLKQASDALGGCR